MSAIMAAPATFAERLKAALEAAHLSQRQLALRMGVRPATVNAWIGGRNVPQFDLACRLSRLLGVSLESLCDPSWHDAPEEQEP